MTQGGGSAGIEVVRATSVVALADHLAEGLRAAPPGDAFASIEVAVPGRGMERWLAQRLGGVLGATPQEAGVCANVGFPFVGGTVQRVVADVLGEEPRDRDPWAPDRLAWPLMELLADLPGEEVLAPLRAHLTEAGQPVDRRRMPLARRVADLFDRYALYRPEMVAAWRDGHAVDGDGGPLPANLAWQPVLWRWLQERLATPSPDRRLREAIELLRSGRPVPGSLPERTIVFGVLALPPLHLELLAALGSRAPVTLYTITPCPAWPVTEPRPVVRNPLLVASGARARDAHTVLQPHLAGASLLDAGRPDPPSPGGATGGTALEVLQADVREDRRRGHGGVARSVLHPDDRSVQIHTCHGLVRQLEVLREVLLGLLEDDPGLEPRDIVVLTPDVTAVAPLLPAAFPTRTPDGPASTSGPVDLPIRVADRSLGEDSEVTRALLAVLELVSGRAGASEVLDLLASSPVRARFGLTATDLERLPAWLRGSGISWGRDAAHRAELIGLDDDAHTWEAGLDRMTLGAAMADDGTRLVGGVRPYDEVEGSSVDLLARVAAATDELFDGLVGMTGPRTIDGWVATLTAVLDRLFDPGPGPQRPAALADDLVAVRAALADLAGDSARPDGTANEVPLTLEELRGLLADHLGTSSSHPATGTGSITVTGLVPLRNLPHRVVCLVGMDDGAVPRTGDPVGFDLLEVPRRPGDPDPRLEDRQLLLDAILAAGDHLVITTTGHDPRTNEERQPAVPISELIDVLTASVDDAGRLVTEHPLQPHSPRYFRDPLPGETGLPRAFDPAHLAAAEAANGAGGRAGPFLARPLPPPPADLVDLELIELDDLVAFLEHPVRFLLQRRLQLSLGADDPRLEDRDPLELDGLQRWALGQGLLEHQLAGVAVDRWRSVTLAARTTPVGGLGTVALDGVEALVGALVDQCARIQGPVRSVPIDVRLPVEPAPGLAATARVVGSVEVHGDTLRHVSVSKVGARQRVAAWLRLLALMAADPAVAPTAVLLGRHDRERDRAATPATLDPALAGVDATAQLGAIVELYLRGHRELLPLLPTTSQAYVTALVGGTGHEEAIAAAHSSAWQVFGSRFCDGADPYVVQALGLGSDLAEVAADHPFAAEAERLWTPILAAGGTA